MILAWRLRCQGSPPEHAGAPAELLGSLEKACKHVSHLDEKAKPWVSYARLLFDGATAQDHDLVLAGLGNHYTNQIAALAAIRDCGFRQRLVLAATSPSHEDADRFKPLEILCAAERKVPSSARTEIQAICSAWLAEDDPAVRLWALDELHGFGWIEPVHLQPLLELLNGPIGISRYSDESSFRGLCGELILEHFPEHATALHGPLLAVFRGQCAWFSEPPIPVLLVQSGCPRAPLVVNFRFWFGDIAQGKLCPPPDLRRIRSMLVEHDLFEELAADFADLALSRLDGFGKYDLIYIIADEEITLEPDPQVDSFRRNELNWPDRQRLKHVPALLAGALARRLGTGEDAIQALWTAVGLHGDSCVVAFHQVVQRGTTDPVLRPFAVALVDRWGTDQVAGS